MKWKWRSDADASGSEWARSGEGAGFNGLVSYPAAWQPYHFDQAGLTSHAVCARS